MKKIFDIQLNRLDRINFIYKDKAVPVEDGVNKSRLAKILEKECSGKGVIVFIPIAEYENCHLELNNKDYL